MQSSDCRVCYETASTEDLISPCKCKGSMRYIHPQCWQKTKYFCDLCDFTPLPVSTLYEAIYFDTLLMRGQRQQIHDTIQTNRWHWLFDWKRILYDLCLFGWQISLRSTFVNYYPYGVVLCSPIIILPWIPLAMKKPTAFLVFGSLLYFNSTEERVVDLWRSLILVFLFRAMGALVFYTKWGRVFCIEGYSRVSHHLIERLLEELD